MLLNVELTTRRLSGLVPALAACSLVLAASGSALPFAPQLRVAPAANPIQHVVIIYQENHTFDEILGGLCILDSRCDGAATGKISTGQVIPLRPAPDIPPNVVHQSRWQTLAMHGGQMDQFDLIRGCETTTGYACYEQYTPEQIPNLAALARAFVISDRTFEGGPMPSWGSHLALVAAQTSGFVGYAVRHNPPPYLTSLTGCTSFDVTYTDRTRLALRDAARCRSAVQDMLS